MSETHHTVHHSHDRNSSRSSSKRLGSFLQFWLLQNIQFVLRLQLAPLHCHCCSWWSFHCTELSRMLMVSAITGLHSDYRGKNMESWADVQTMEEYWILTCSLWLALPAFLHNLVSWIAPHTMAWIHPYSFSINKMTRRLNCMEVFLKIGFPDLMCFNLCQIDLQLSSTLCQY